MFITNSAMYFAKPASYLRTDRLTYWLKTQVAMQEVVGSIPGPVQSNTELLTASHRLTFFRSCVAKALSPGDGSCHSIHASV